MNNAGYDVVPFEMDLSSREDILAIIRKAQEYGEIKYLINAADGGATASYYYGPLQP
jgi:short-subunit dehydrogenase